jgi:TM2 domain-containing membrane protein YozV
VSVTRVPVHVQARRSPAAARVISIVPGLGQLYYGAPLRALQYLGGVAGAGGMAALLFSYNEWFAFNLGVAGPILRLVGLLLLELVELSLVIIAISHWIAASWDARQGSIARTEGTAYRPTWWFVKVKRFLFDDPDSAPGTEA